MIGDETGESKRGIFGRIFLEKGGFVRFINDNKPEVV